MQVKALGEFPLIDRMVKILKFTNRRVVVGIGDDAAVLEHTWNKYLLVTIDTLVQGVHFAQKGADYKFLGKKTFLANLSDIAAMGGHPTAAVISLAVPASFGVKQLEVFYRGLEEISVEAGVPVIGGDTVSSPKALVISLCLFGEVPKSQLLLRKGARVGDLICVTGVFGKAAKGKYKTLPPNRVKMAQELARLGFPTAMIDSSDGLSASVRSLADNSETGAELWTASIPNAGTLEQALSGGEDYELVFTVPSKKVSALQRRFKKSVAVVGKIVPSDLGLKLVYPDGRKAKITNFGFKHFGKKS